MDFKFPDVGEGITEGKLVSWKVKVGDSIKADQTIAEVETDKAVVEIPSPTAGVVAELKNKEGDTLNVGEVIMVINEDGSAPTGSSGPAAVNAPKEEPKQEEQPKPVQQTAPAPEPTTQPTPQQPTAVSSEPTPSNSQNYDSVRPDLTAKEPHQDFHGEVRALPKVRHLAKEKGIDLSTVTPTGNHNQITEADLGGGQPVQQQAQPQQEVKPPQGAPNEDLANDLPTFDEHNEKAPASITATQKPVEGGHGYEHTGVVHDPSHSETMNNELLHVRASPSVRKLARERGVDIHNVAPGCSSGVVTCDDVEHASKEHTVKETEQVQPKAEDTHSATSNTPQKRDGSQELTTIRKAIAKKMTLAASIPTVTHIEEVDMTEIHKMREKEKANFAKKGIKLTFLPFIIKALVAALDDFPTFNAHMHDDNTYTAFQEKHVGIAVDTPNGLMVPVIKNAETKSIVSYAKEIVDLATRAKDKKLALDELSGSTISVTSVGSLGGLAFTPILNHPEVAILGVAKIKTVPVVINNQIYAKKMMNLCLTFDHRLVDGADAARFINKIKEYLEDPQELFLEKA